MNTPDLNDARLLARLKHWFDDDDWPTDEVEEQLQTNFGGQSGEWQVIVKASRELGVVLVLSRVPLQASREGMTEAMETITRANDGLFFGGFDLNLDTGAMQFRTSIVIGSDLSVLTDQVIRDLVYRNVLTVDRYLPAIRAVVEDGQESAAAITAAEQDSE